MNAEAVRFEEISEHLLQVSSHLRHSTSLVSVSCDHDEVKSARFHLFNKNKEKSQKGQRKRRTFEYSKEKLGALSEKTAAVYNENFKIIPVI